MARTSTFQNPQKQIVQTLEDQHKYDLPTLRRLGVEASPVNQMVTPFVSPESSSAARLAGALDIKAPLFEKFLNERVDNFNQEEAARGEKESLAGNPSDVTSLAFYKSYMKTQGYLGAMKDQEKMQQEWESAPKVDDQGNPVAFSQWSQQWWQKNTAGLEDKDYLEGYMPIMTKTFHAAQLKDAEEHTKNLIESRNGSAREVFRNTLTEAAKAGGMDMPTYEAVRQAAINMGMTPAEANAQFVAALEELAATATTSEQVAAVQSGAKLLMEKHTDGTPGFAKYGEVKAIDLANKATSAALSNLNTAEAFHDKEREIAREDKMFEITQLMITDPDTAMQKLTEMATDPRTSDYFDSKSLFQTFNAYRSAAQKIENEGMATKATELLANAYEGKLSYKDVTLALKSGEIGQQGARNLISAINQRKTQARAEANAARQQENAIYKSPQYKAAREIIQSIPASDNMDFDSSKSRMLRSQRATALATLAEKADGMKPDELVSYAQNLKKNVDVVLDGVKQGGDAAAFVNTPILYPTIETFEQAVRDGRIATGTEDYNNHMAFFKSLIKKPKETKK